MERWVQIVAMSDELKINTPQLSISSKWSANEER